MYSRATYMLLKIASEIVDIIYCSSELIVAAISPLVLWPFATTCNDSMHAERQKRDNDIIIYNP